MMYDPTRRESGGGGSPGAPVDHRLHHFILGGPHPRRGRPHKNNRGGATPRIFGLPLLDKVWGRRGWDEGGVDLVGHSRAPSIFTCGDTLLLPIKFKFWSNLYFYFFLPRYSNINQFLFYFPRTVFFPVSFGNLQYWTKLTDKKP